MRNDNNKKFWKFKNKINKSQLLLMKKNLKQKIYNIK